MELEDKLKQRFADSFSISDSDQCWEWKGLKNNYGYPRFQYKGKRLSAIRLFYEMYYKKPIPEGKVISHTCGNTSCMNPSHLYLTDRSQLAIKAWKNKNDQKTPE